jgi:site-specific recombinase XerD
MLVRHLCNWAKFTGVRIGPHTFRHMAATNYLRNGGSELTLQIMLGHTSLDMTRRYVLVLGTEDMARVHEKASPVYNLGIK